MRLLFAVLALALVSGCICVPPDDGTDSSTTTISTMYSTTMTTLREPAGKASCESQGGMWGRIGLAPKESCNLPTSDAGKECSDSSECEGSCIADGAANGEDVKGKCTGWKITVGCRAFVNAGKASVICVD